MSNLNKVMVQGRVVRNAESTTSDSGLKVVKFSIATNRYKKNPDGTPGEEVFFFPLVVFGKYAENIESFLLKGQQVIVEGYLRQNRWEKDGEKRTEIAIGVEKLHLVFGNKKSTDGENEVVTNFQRDEDDSDFETDFSFENDEIPF